MIGRTRVLALLFAGVLAGCSAPRPSSDLTAVRGSIDSTLAAHALHFQQGNIDSLVDTYTADAVVRPAGMEPFRGRDALRTTLASWLAAAPIRKLAYTTDEIVAYGDSVYQISSFEAIVQPPGAAEMTDRGSCMVLWTRAAGVWRIHRSICNSRVPPSQPAARPAGK